MKMEFLELPFEAIALRFHTAVAAAAAADVGLWRIIAVGSRSDASSPLSAPSPSPETETEPSPPVRADPAPTQPSQIRPCAAPKERFTAYEEEEEVEEEEHVRVDGEMTASLVERMKLICEGIDVEIVATTLALADQHNCRRL